MKDITLIDTKPTDPNHQRKRLAAIDIGTNSIRCIAVEVDTEGNFRVLDDEKATVRLGEGLSETGLISRAAQQRATEALQRMVNISTGLNAEIAAVVATSAVRKANNREQFLNHIHKTTGLAIDVISGEQEANLACLSVHHNFAMENQRFAVADIGGGSVEIIIASGHHTEAVTSLELGAVFLTENFISNDPVTFSELKRLRKHIRKTLKKTGIGAGLPISCIIGSGGTMTNIGSMVMALRGENYESIHRYEIIHSEIIHLLTMLTRKNQKERMQTPGLNPERADIILAGMILTDELMRHSRTNLLKINAQGIREGLILKSLQERGLIDQCQQKRDWRDSISEFARSCRFDEFHSNQVNRLAQSIFTSIASKHNLTERESELLEAAVMLHDIGYFISYDSHHKHSYHLIRHANLFGFTPREREIIANLARYHRKSKPKKNHENFSGLTAEDQRQVRQLGGILRLADGLDRRRNGQVEEINCRINDGIFELTMIGQGDLSVEHYGANSKGDLFESAFGYKLVITRKEMP
jgi:exopolyphosphatase / guanosine-5'-triphosphate,3'-diphosphate pyrophosphatase